jgi:hypothetical protein
MLLFGLGVEEYREIFANGLETGREHLLLGNADDDPVLFVDRNTEQPVSYSPPD